MGKHHSPFEVQNIINSVIHFMMWPYISHQSSFRLTFFTNSLQQYKVRFSVNLKDSHFYSVKSLSKTMALLPQGRPHNLSAENGRDLEVRKTLC